jgi:adenine-specific DNA methylase
LDPPYVRKNIYASSSYLNYYHFLEGLSKYYQWPELINYERQHLPLRDSIYQNDFTNSIIKENFEEMLLKFQKSKIIVSYKNGGNPSIQYIISLMKKIKRNTRTVSIPYKYALKKQNGNENQNREVLIIGT